jgi:hypothetical protein
VKTKVTGVQMNLLARMLLLAIVLGGYASAASAACSDDLVATSEKLKRTRTVMENAASGTEAAKCAAYRQHVASLTQVRAVFARCDTGANKAKNDAQVGATITEVNKQARQACKK